MQKLLAGAGLGLWLGVFACFNDADPVVAEGCPEGTSGCMCYGNDTCDGDLVCTDTKCLSPSCVVGRENCPCDGTAFQSTLMCLDGICKPDTAGTGDETGSTSTTSTTSASGTSTDPTNETSATSDPTTSTGGGDACTPQEGDPVCASCVKEHCCDAWTNCRDDERCSCIFECVADGSKLVECQNNCGGNSPVFLSLMECAQQDCPTPCSALVSSCFKAPPTACTFCAGGACCDTILACRSDPACECLEACLASAPNTAAACAEQCGTRSLDPLYDALSRCAGACQHPGSDQPCYPTL